MTQNIHDSEEEIEVDNTYQGEEEGMEEDEDNENDSDDHDPQKAKEKYTPLWKYVTRLNGGKGGGTTIYMPPLSYRIHRFLYPCEKASMWEYVLG
jgi:hypothetical protein